MKCRSQTYKSLSVFVLLILLVPYAPTWAFSSHTSREQIVGATPARSSVQNLLLRWNPNDDTNIEVDCIIDSHDNADDSNPTIPLPAVDDSSMIPIQLAGIAAIAGLLFFAPPAALALDHPPIDQNIFGIPIPVPDVRYFLAGGLCAATSHGITTPIDVVKTRIQAEPDVFGNEGGVLDAAKLILEKDGPSALLGGLAPTVVGYGIEGAVKFGLYESLKPIFAAILLSVVGNDMTIPYLGASVLAGAAASLLLCPMERVRIRMVTEQQNDDGSSSSTGLLSTLSVFVQEEGVESLFRGIGAMLSKQVPYTIFKQVSFDVFAGMLYGAAAAANFSEADVKGEVAILAAFLASILACIASQPGDVILTATYKNPTNSYDGEREVGATNIIDPFGVVVSRISAEKGIGGFFTGITARFLHVGAIITSQLVLYDIIKQLLGLPATGTH